MQVPRRKGGKYTYIKPDPHLTEEKFNALKKERENIINNIRPPLIEEVKSLAELGDFSENAAYQIAKGRLRGLNQKILDIEDQLRNVHIIKASKNTNTIQLGHKVTIEANNHQQTFQILGSAETNPSQGIISHNSPLGKALIGHKKGDKISINLAGRNIEYKIIKIE
jgi:transcription elongation factor GreA